MICRNAKPVCLLLMLIMVLPTMAEPVRPEVILAFVKAWDEPVEYAWNRETVVRKAGEVKPFVSIEDKGRLRISILSVDEGLATLDLHLLRFDFETNSKGEGRHTGSSDLVRKQLPLMNLHWATGFGSEEPMVQVNRVNTTQQLGLVRELLDFRGVVPDTTPALQAEWSYSVEPDRGPEFAFDEKLTRNFRLVETSALKQGKMLKIRFEDSFEIVPHRPTRPWESIERTGEIFVSWPEGLISAAQWTETAVESSPHQKGREEIITESSVKLVCQPPTERKVIRAGDQKAQPRSGLVLPPR